ncbi:MAG: class I SAM-dependent methyltransferase [Phycisphaerae bacterium]|nr:class I SAM-dependent methyltransferase [Phycisphaerae bacterium]NUQ45523.1 class I SAM-dependent methyltransferase [Phycisphaerae bacterium]
MPATELDEPVRTALAEVAAFNRSRDDALAIPEEAGAFMHALILASGATRGLELGTSYGYSGLWIASALHRNGGRLVTIERESRKSEIAGRHFERAGLSECIDRRIGAIADALSGLSGPFDFVFVDADKEASLDYVRRFRPKLAARAVIVTDNILHPPHFNWPEYLAVLRNDANLFSTLVPVGNGMELTIVR